MSLADFHTLVLPRYYLSGPMSGLPDCNYPTFAKAAAELRAQGYDVLSAHEIEHFGETTPGAGLLPWTRYLRDDMRELLQCDAIILLEGWPQSKGARLELTTALALEMPVFFWDAHRKELLCMNLQPPAAEVKTA